MEEVKVGRAIVRIHGTAEREKTEAATVDFLKKALAQKKRKAAAANEKQKV